MMLKTIEELIAYTDERGNNRPSDAHRLVLRRPGLTSPETTRLLSVLPSLPPSFVDTVQRLDLWGKVLGFFRLWPSVWSRRDWLSALILANTSEENPLLDLLKKEGLLEVAEGDSENICVRQASDGQAGGEVFSIYVCEPALVPIARSFEEFLILAGNLNQIHVAHNAVPSATAETPGSAMRHRLERLGIPEAMHEYWVNSA